MVGAEPSARMSGLARLLAAEASGPLPVWVRGWSDALPFATGSFDAVICKGAIDHFDAPALAIAEMARVTRRDGRVVLAIANFESLACRAARGLDRVRERWLGRELRRGRRHYDVPHDHFTRYELGADARAGRRASSSSSGWRAISLGLGRAGLVARAGAPAGAAGSGRCSRALDALARRLPVAGGRGGAGRTPAPRARAASTSA